MSVKFRSVPLLANALRASKSHLALCYRRGIAKQHTVPRSPVSIILLLVLLALSAPAIRAQDVSLKGVTQVQVEFVFIDGEGTGPCAEKVLAKSFGLLEDTVRTETELRLRQAGLRTGPGQFLRIAVAGCASIASINIELREWATVDVRGRRGVVATWREGGILLSPTDVRATIQDFVSKFVNRWLADK